MSRHYGHQLRILHWQFDQTVSGALAQMDLTAAQGQIMGFLSHREPPCSRDIEEAFQLTHPTVSGLLSRLEKTDTFRRNLHKQLGSHIVLESYNEEDFKSLMK